MATTKTAKAAVSPASSSTPTPAAHASPLSPFRVPVFAEILEEIENLLSQSRLAFLLGAGCSRCAGLPMMDELTAKVTSQLKDPSLTILNVIIDGFKGTGRCTIEDYMSELVDLIAIAERRTLRAARAGVSLAGTAYGSNELTSALDDIKRAIANGILHPASPTSIESHRQFIRTIHGTLRSGKGYGSRSPIEYFTLNYDTLIEDALSLERIAFVDGFYGGATGWWGEEQYNDSSAKARVYKLHGSIDWCLCDGDILPRRIRDGLGVPSRINHLLIWPAATKYRETQRDPYAQLVSRMRGTLRPQANSEIVLCICGYAFADEHLNFELDRALRESNERLTILAFTSDDEPKGQLKTWHEDPATTDRIRLHTNRGFFHASRQLNSADSLSWWKFEVLTEILSGSR
jgi:hypothetical protein